MNLTKNELNQTQITAVSEFMEFQFGIRAPIDEIFTESNTAKRDILEALHHYYVDEI